jgi:hypothetical protein
MVPGSPRNWIAVNKVQQSSLNKNENKNMTTLTKTNSIHRSPLQRGLLLIPLLLACFALLPRVQAAPDPAAPPPSNTRDGQGSMAHISTGINNSAFGTNALNKLTIGNNNAAQGNSALFSDVDGTGNTGLGVLALRLNIHGNSNVAVGFQALHNNIGGDSNNAVGYQALLSNTDGVWNNGVGYQALFNNISGDNNTAIGDSAGFQVTGSGNVCIGQGIEGVEGENDTTRIRNVYSSVASTRAVYVDSDNKIGTILSSRRFKDEIKPMDKASEAILALKPVTFRYKKEIESNGAIMFGLIAEEVEKVDPDLVSRNTKGEAETVRYEAVNAMLLNEFLKQHRKVDQQEATIVQLKQDFQSKFAEQQKQIKALTTGLEKVNNQLELSKPAPQMVGNNR